MESVDNIFNKRTLPGYNKKNRKSIYSFLFALFQIAFLDTKKVIKAFFVFLADYDCLFQHARAWDIPTFPFDTEETLRERLTIAASFKEDAGQYKTVIHFLDIYVKDRYRILEYPKISFRIGYSKIGYTAFGGGARLVIKIKDLLVDEVFIISTYLESTLDPDIEIHIVKEI